MSNNERKMAPGPVLSELSYLEFHREKSKLANGTYRVIEHDGEINYAVLGDFRGLSMFDLDWYTEDEYIGYRESDSRLNSIMDFDPDLDEDLMDSWDFAMGRSDNVVVAEVATAEDGFKVEKSLGDILREHIQADTRSMDDTQYAEHCESVEQNRRDGVTL